MMLSEFNFALYRPNTTHALHEPQIKYLSGKKILSFKELVGHK
jgi:hypothetical protein